MKILITGACGVIGRILTKALTTEYTLVLVDLRAPDEITDEQFQRLASQHSFVKGDISDQSTMQWVMRAYKPEAVIHLAAILGSHTAWEQILWSNVAGAVTVLETSLSGEVDRVIYASTNNVYGGYEEEAIKAGTPLHLQTMPPLLHEETPPRPDSRYAVAKLMIEEYATYLSTAHGFRTFGVRIGTVRELDDPQLQTKESELIPRFKTTWLRHQDLIQLIKLCLTTELRHGIYNAISGIPGTPGIFIDVSKAMAELGYCPGGFNGK